MNTSTSKALPSLPDNGSRRRNGCCTTGVQRITTPCTYSGRIMGSTVWGPAFNVNDAAVHEAWSTSHECPVKPAVDQMCQTMLLSRVCHVLVSCLPDGRQRRLSLIANLVRRATTLLPRARLRTNGPHARSVANPGHGMMRMHSVWWLASSARVHTACDEIALCSSCDATEHAIVGAGTLRDGAGTSRCVVGGTP